MYGPLKQATKAVRTELSIIAAAVFKATNSATITQAQEALLQPLGLFILTALTCTGRPYKQLLLRKLLKLRSRARQSKQLVLTHPPHSYTFVPFEPLRVYCARRC